MADEKFADEILSDDELDNVAGGTLLQTANDMYRFTNEMRFCSVAASKSKIMAAVTPTNITCSTLKAKKFKVSPKIRQ